MPFFRSWSSLQSNSVRISKRTFCNYIIGKIETIQTCYEHWWDHPWNSTWLFPKAFYTIVHLTLLEKIHTLNFSKQALELIHSYVSEPKQFAQVYDKSSSVKLNNFGDPHGSILGPVLISGRFSRERCLWFITICWWFLSVQTCKTKKPQKMCWIIIIWSGNSITVFFK